MDGDITKYVENLLKHSFLCHLAYVTRQQEARIHNAWEIAIWEAKKRFLFHLHMTK